MHTAAVRMVSAKTADAGAAVRVAAVRAADAFPVPVPYRAHALAVPGVPAVVGATS